MADDFYAQAYQTGASPEIAKALADIQSNKIQSDLWQKYASQVPQTVEGLYNPKSFMLQNLGNSMSSLSNQNSNDIVKDQVIPEQVELAKKLQRIRQTRQGSLLDQSMPFNNQNQMPPSQDAAFPQNAQEYIKQAGDYGMFAKMGIPGAEAENEAFKKITSTPADNTYMANGSFNPNDIANAKANLGLEENKFNTMSRFNPQTGQPELVNEADAKRAVQQGNPVATGMQPYSPISLPTGETRYAPTASVYGNNISTTPSKGDVNTNDEGVKVQQELPNQIQTLSTRRNIINNILQSADQNNPTKTGQVVSTLLANLGNGSTDAGKQILIKYINQLYVLETGNAPTDASRDAIMNSLINGDMQPEAMKKLMTQAMKINDLELQRNNALYNYASQNKSPIEIANQSRKLKQLFNPSFAFLDNDALNNKQKFHNTAERLGYTTPEEKKQFLNSYFNYNNNIRALNNAQ